MTEVKAEERDIIMAGRRWEVRAIIHSEGAAVMLR